MKLLIVLLCPAFRQFLRSEYFSEHPYLKHLYRSKVIQVRFELMNPSSDCSSPVIALPRCANNPECVAIAIICPVRRLTNHFSLDRP
jgi:hypothetical protein